MEKPLIAVLRGGYTGESVISMQSADNMMAAMDRARFHGVFITLHRDRWECTGTDGGPLPFDRGQFTVDLGQGPRRISAALIAVHGTPGEDGKVQGYLDMLGVPYQTGGVLNMALTMSKFATTGLLRQMGFPVAASLLLHRHDPEPLERVLHEVGLPCFVKPDSSGSSLGISKVKTREELLPALEKAFAEDERVLCEAFVKGRELTCGVINLHGHVRALPVCEIRTSREFFDYEAKYHATDTQEIVPAPIPEAVATLVQRRSEAIYRALNCRGMVRIDNFWLDTGPDSRQAVTIEVNTVPGFTAVSIFPRMLKAAGISQQEAVNGLIEEMLASRKIS